MLSYICLLFTFFVYILFCHYFFLQSFKLTFFSPSFFLSFLLLSVITSFVLLQSYLLYSFLSFHFHSSSSLLSSFYNFPSILFSLLSGLPQFIIFLIILTTILQLFLLEVFFGSPSNSIVFPLSALKVRCCISILTSHLISEGQQPIIQERSRLEGEGEGQVDGRGEVRGGEK